MEPDDVRRHWAERSAAYSPGYYAYHGPDGRSDRLRATLDRFAGRGASVLELGCSSGRHLAHLHEHGYGDLHGVDVNDRAFDVMADAYPELAAAGTFYHDAIEAVVAEFDDDAFDAVYSVETLQHLHPDSEWVFGELSRLAGDLLVTVENEGDDPGRGGTDPPVHYVEDDLPLYYRQWAEVFTDRGMVEARSESVGRNTLRAFQPVGD